MDKLIVDKLLNDPKLLDHFKENSYWIKYLNRNPNSFKEFTSKMKEIYKERVSDKVNSAIDGIDMISTVIDTIK